MNVLEAFGWCGIVGIAFAAALLVSFSREHRR